LVCHVETGLLSVAARLDTRRYRKRHFLQN
jgi:hypothetical protein